MKFKRLEFIKLIKGVLNEKITEENKKLNLYDGYCFVNVESARCLIRDFYEGSFKGTIEAYPLLYLLDLDLDIEVRVENNMLMLESHDKFFAEVKIPFLSLELRCDELRIAQDKRKLQLPAGFAKKAISLFGDSRAQSGIYTPFILSDSGLAVLDPTKMYIYGKFLNVQNLVFLPFRVLDILALTDVEEIFYQEIPNSCLFEIDKGVMLQVARGFDIKEQQKALNAIMRGIESLKFYGELDGKIFKDSLKLISTIEPDLFCEVKIGDDKIKIKGQKTKITIDANTIKEKIKFRIMPQDILTFLSDGPLIIKGYEERLLGLYQGEEQFIKALG